MSTSSFPELENLNGLVVSEIISFRQKNLTTLYNRIVFNIRSVPGIGRRTVEQLTAVHLDTLGQLRQASVENIVEAGILRYVNF